MIVSIIIPIYNGAKYINKMYTSLSNQTVKDFELIYINDGSNDNSLQILLEIAKKDERVKVYDQENMGICASRNLGIINSHGEYLIFLDQDDGIENNLIENYIMAIKNKNVDMAVFSKVHYYISDGIISKKEYQKFDDELVTDKRKILEYLFNIDNKKRLMTIWNCIYRKDIINKFNIRFDEHFKYGNEDGMFNIEYIFKCNKVYFSNNYYYHYYIRNGISTITKYNNSIIDDYLYFIEKLSSIVFNINNSYLNELVKLYILRFFSNIYIKSCKYNSGIDDKICILKKVMNIDSFRYALSFTNMKYYKNFSIKYFYWDIFNFFLKRKKYFISVCLLDFLKIIKKI